ncbi:MAG TPA: hypothetical protein VH477_08910, partial [Bryobacteraceae bacterium]
SGAADNAQASARLYTDQAVSAALGQIQTVVGPPGPQGDPGPQGPQGPAGAQGPQGAAGPQGPAGATGATGPQGPAGPKGDPGATGATGLQGPAGTTGSQGPQGPAGATGPQGAAGTNGNTVWNGTGTPASTLGQNGDFFLNNSTHVLYGPKASGAWPGTGVSLVGPQGPTGPTGATGPQGPQGATGATGSQGSAGPTGATGPQGPAGPAGPQGPAGSVLYGSYAAIPATCTTGTLYVITSGLFDRAVCTATNTWSFIYGGRTITPAARLSLTTSGASSTVTSSSTNGYELDTAPAAGSPNLTMRYFNAPAAPYTVTLAVKMPVLDDTTNYRELFFGWTDATTGFQGMNCGTGSGSFSSSVGCRLATFNTAGGYSGTQQTVSQIPSSLASVQYVQLVNDGTTLSVNLCSDADNCSKYASFTAATFFTSGNPTKIAWGLQNSTPASGGATSLTVIGTL